MQKIKFDTDSFMIGVDTCRIYCITNNIDHFETCVPNNQNNKSRIKLVDSDKMEVKSRLTVMWKLEDDDGVVHNIKIKDMLYVSKLDRCLLSPRHVAQ